MARTHQKGAALSANTIKGNRRCKHPAENRNGRHLPAEKKQSPATAKANAVEDVQKSAVFCGISCLPRKFYIQKIITKLISCQESSC